jgi:hypothetical protein
MHLTQFQSRKSGTHFQLPMATSFQSKGLILYRNPTNSINPINSIETMNAFNDQNDLTVPNGHNDQLVSPFLIAYNVTEAEANGFQT